MLLIGLTGSIGMGKSTTAAMFREAGVPVFDSDAAVHGLYRGPAAPAIEAAFPGTVIAGAVDRSRLGTRVLGDPEAMRRLEAIVHPLVRAEETAFLAVATARGHRAAVLDIPLLFESGGEGRVHLVCVVSAGEAVQKQRVLARPGMTPGKLAAIVARQVPDAEKRRRAHVVIGTGRGLASARAGVNDLLRAVAAMG